MHSLSIPRLGGACLRRQEAPHSSLFERLAIIRSRGEDVEKVAPGTAAALHGRQKNVRAHIEVAPLAPGLLCAEGTSGCFHLSVATSACWRKHEFRECFRLQQVRVLGLTLDCLHGAFR